MWGREREIRRKKHKKVMLIFGTRKIPWDFKWPGPPPHTHTHTPTHTPPSFPCILSVFITFPITQRLIHPNHFFFFYPKKNVYFCAWPHFLDESKIPTRLWNEILCAAKNSTILDWGGGGTGNIISSVSVFLLPLLLKGSLTFDFPVGTHLSASLPSWMLVPSNWWIRIFLRRDSTQLGVATSSPHHPRFNPQCWSRVKKGDWNVWSVWD